MVSVRINGSLELRRLADQIRVTGDKGLGKEMAAGLRQVAKPVQTAVRESATATMPKRGGYAEAFTKSLRFRTALRNAKRDAFFRVTTFADGVGQRRDIDALEAGILRHPVFGRYRRRKGGGRHPNPWAVTKVQAGFHERGTKDAAARAEREMKDVIGDFAERLAKG